MNNARECPLCNMNDPVDVGLVQNSKGLHRLQCAHCELIYFDKTDYVRPHYNPHYNRHFSGPEISGRLE